MCTISSFLHRTKNCRHIHSIAMTARPCSSNRSQEAHSTSTHCNTMTYVYADFNHITLTTVGPYPSRAVSRVKWHAWLNCMTFFLREGLQNSQLSANWRQYYSILASIDRRFPPLSINHIKLQSFSGMSLVLSIRCVSQCYGSSLGVHSKRLCLRR